MPASLTDKFVLGGCLLYPFTIVSYAFWGSAFFQGIALFIGITVFLIMISRKTKISIGGLEILLLIMLLLAVFGIYAAAWSNMRNYAALLVLISGLGIAWASLELHITKYTYEYPFYLFLVLTLALIIYGYDKYTFNTLLATGSRNVYSSILIAFAFGYLFSRKIRGKNASIFPAFMVVLFSFALYSRVGLFISFIFILMILFGNKKFLTIGVISIIAIIVFSATYNVVSLLTDYSNFSKGLSTERYAMWAAYLAGIDHVGLFFGKNFNQIDLISIDFKGNPHSAYIRLHAYFGLGAFFLMLLILFSLIKLLLSRYWIYSAILVVFLFRASFDPIYMIWWFDYLFYPCVFFFIFRRYFDHKSSLKKVASHPSCSPSASNL